MAPKHFTAETGFPEEVKICLRHGRNVSYFEINSHESHDNCNYKNPFLFCKLIFSTNFSPFKQHSLHLQSLNNVFKSLMFIFMK